MGQREAAGIPSLSSQKSWHSHLNRDTSDLILLEPICPSNVQHPTPWQEQARLPEGSFLA